MSKIDSKNKISTFFTRELPLMVASSIDCITIGKVTKYDKSKHECNVQPLAKQSDGSKRPIYNYCIVPMSIWQTDKFMLKLEKNPKNKIKKWKQLKVGSVVAVGACDREIDNLNLKSKKTYKIETNRTHSFNDGIVLEVIS